MHGNMAWQRGMATWHGDYIVMSHDSWPACPLTHTDRAVPYAAGLTHTDRAVCCLPGLPCPVLPGADEDFETALGDRAPGAGTILAVKSSSGGKRDKDGGGEPGGEAGAKHMLYKKKDGRGGGRKHGGGGGRGEGGGGASRARSRESDADEAIRCCRANVGRKAAVVLVIQQRLGWSLVGRDVSRRAVALVRLQWQH